MKKLLLGLLAPLMVLSPASAEVQDGTYDLIQTVKQHVTVNIDSPHCDENPNMAGSFAPRTEVMTLCPRGHVDADDHDTVRHEVWHIIQYCLTEPNSRYLQTVFEPWSDEWYEHIMSELSPRTVAFIKESYPSWAWNAEFEAFSIAKSMTSSQLEQMFTKACLNND